MKDKLRTRNILLVSLGCFMSAFTANMFLTTLPVYAEKLTGLGIYAGIMTSAGFMAAAVLLYSRTLYKKNQVLVN